MSKIEKKLLRNKKKTEKRNQKKQKLNENQIKNTNFPNLAVPLSLFFLAPAFLILTIISHATKQTDFIKYFSVLWTGMGFIGSWLILHPQQRWFTTYGDKAIIKNEIPWKLTYGIVYIIFTLLIVFMGLQIKTDLHSYFFTIFIIITCIFGNANKKAILWDAIPMRLFGFKKYEFVTKNISYNGILRNYHKIQENEPIEGTFIGRDWYYLKKGEPNIEETETASK